VTDETQPCLLFDIDGTLVDTDHIHLIAFNTVTSDYGVSVDAETYKAVVSGRVNDVVLKELLPHVPVSEHEAIGRRKEALFREMASEMKPLAGLMELLDWADTVKLRYAAVTNAPRENATLVLSSIKATERFSGLVIAEDLAHPKPHPLPYLTGLQRLNGDAIRSVAFEDSRTGISSAHAAGLGVVGMTTSLDGAVLKAVGASVTASDYHDAELKRFIKDRTGLS